MACFREGSLDWYPNAALFNGAGKTDAGAGFSYSANWRAPGRWWVEILTRKRRFIFRPLEKLQVQLLGTVTSDFVEDIDYSLEQDLKPGLYRQVEAFLNPDSPYAGNLVSIEEHQKNCEEIFKPIEIG